MAQSRHHNVYNLPRGHYEGPITDPLFPNKHEVHCGSRFTFHGRTVKGAPTTWVVERIWTVNGRGYDKVRSMVFDVRTLDDVLELRCEETLEVRRSRFTYLSYSAIWRLV